MASVIRGSGSSSLGGNLDIEGVLTYEDVTSVDSIGIVTARSGINVGTGASISSPDTNELALGTNNVERLRIASGGSVGIGTASPRDPVHIFHPTNNVNLLIESGDANSYLAFRDNTTTSDSAVYLGAEGNNLKFITSAAERLLITSGGDILPGGNKTQDLGSSSNSFANLYAGNIELSDDYPAIKPSLNLNFAGARALDPRITFTRSSVGTYVGRDGIIKTASANEPRFDHDPITLESLGLLIEESRTNYNGDTGADTDIGRMGNQPGSTSNTIAPNGENTAIIPVPNATADRFEVQIATSIQSTDEVWTFSWFEKNIAFSGTEPIAVPEGHVNLSNVTDAQLIGTYPNGWKRWSVTATITDGSITSRFRYYMGASIGIGNNNVAAFWGHQSEKGSFATSYIRGNGVSVTRQADSPYIDGESFDEFYNQSEGTIVSSHSILEGISATHNLYTYQVAPDSGTSEAPFRLVDRNSSYGNTLAATSITSNANVCFFTASGNPVTAANTKMKVAFAIKKDDFAVSFNGTATQTDTAGLVSGDNDHLSIGYYKPSPQAYLNGHIQRLTYYPKRLTDAQLQLLTS